MRRLATAAVLCVLTATACEGDSGLRYSEADCEGGGFLAVSAVRDRSPGDVLSQAAEFIRTHGVAAERTDRSTCPPYEAHAYPPSNGWTVVIWPGYFGDVAAARTLSGSLGTTVVTTHEHDNDYWTLVVFEDGRLTVRFASQPGYFAESAAERRRLTKKWSGPPARLAEAFGLPLATVEPYLVHNATGKAFPDDEFERDFFWVFVDLWRRLGIAYPNGDKADRSEDFSVFVDLWRRLSTSEPEILQVGTDFLDKLPHEGEL